MVIASFSDEVTLNLTTLVDEEVLFEAREAEAAEQAILSSMERLQPGALLVFDLGGVRVSSEAARQLLRRVLHRLRSGEIIDRYIVLRGLGSSRYNVEVMLQGEGLASVERTQEAPRWRLLGRLEPALVETFQALASRPTATAKVLRKDLKLKSTQAATNRLATLTKAALARRVTEQSLEGGGREYVYAAVR
jgi:hypothetical protein